MLLVINQVPCAITSHSAAHGGCHPVQRVSVRLCIVLHMQVPNCHPSRYSIANAGCLVASGNGAYFGPHQK